MKVVRIIGIAMLAMTLRRHSQRPELDTSSARANSDRPPASAA